MSWPSTVDYLAAVADPSHCFYDEQLAAATPAAGLFGAPLSFTGNFGCILKLDGKDGTSWAVKCFTRPVSTLQQRYNAISEHLGRRHLPFLADFAYLARGIQVGRSWFPVLRMEWVEGEHLNDFVREQLPQPHTLRRLAELWLRLSRDLRQAGIGHGDLQHGNVLLTASSRPGTVAIRLIDYDGMWVPAVAGMASEERGHVCYQHPRRGPEDAGPEVDRFSHLVIYTALRALAGGNGPELWQRHDSGENLLFRAEDLAEPSRSALLRSLWEQGGDLQHLVGHLAAATQGPCSATPLVHELVEGEKVRPPAAGEMLRVSRLLGGEVAPTRIMARPQAAAREVLTLEVVEGPELGRQFTLVGHDTFVVGRSLMAHLQLPEGNRLASRFHCIIEVNGSSCAVQDLGSRNGTHVNRRRIERAALKSGDLLRVGQTHLRVQLAMQELSTGPSDGEEDRDGTRMPMVAGYRLVRELGRGGMGVVYLAVRASDQRVFALKTVVPRVQAGAEAVARLLREASLLRRLSHPNLVTCHEMGASGEGLYFAMDLVEGSAISRLVQSEGPLPVGRAVGLLRQALAGLEHAHGRRLVHRDIKPTNLLVEQVKGKEHVWIANFGLARIYQASPLSGLTLAQDMVGNMAFVPPEQLLNFRIALPASDQYAAAAVLYHLLTGRHVHDLKEKPAEQVAQVLNEDAVPIQERRPGLPRRLAAAIHRALAHDPRERWPDIAAFRQALEPFER